MNKLQDLNKKLNEDCERKIKQIVSEVFRDVDEILEDATRRDNDAAVHYAIARVRILAIKKYGLGGESKTLDELKEDKHEDDTSGV